MAHYKAYFLALDGRFVKAKDIIEDGDQAAVIAARGMIGMNAVELWEQDRKIVRFDAAKLIASPDLQPREQPHDLP
ncbi:hypothetical protein FNL55_05850 [Tardiphaga sp. vice352]|uniref:hypothetical protein n=1 Tax=unclassified Tardiphaga TaxID=2631404 RepID=UPI0011643748|nr:MULTISPECIES: hypothetical protein [unclassified Tardiphaga]QDM15525.1 hypothetical protein FNL53_06005 [Tardiphaga sp. vice278]QDM20555.1 hypothetical protein FIU28_04925 [Tardiphaga sp. vice154]QDM25685.1 hypothetical protein FNL56_05770 [Tardiphaga sp. vice304]QDM30897.1 hypothetical protein FNL55_05850 [Tardiphaga sp. vice352]